MDPKKNITELSVNELEEILSRKVDIAVSLYTTTKIDDAVKRSTKESMSEFMKVIGLNTEKPIELQQDFTFLRRQRKGAEQSVDWMKKSMLVAAITGLLGLLWVGFKDSLLK